MCYLRSPDLCLNPLFTYNPRFSETVRFTYKSSKLAFSKLNMYVFTYVRKPNMYVSRIIPYNTISLSQRCHWLARSRLGSHLWTHFGPMMAFYYRKLPLDNDTTFTLYIGFRRVINVKLRIIFLQLYQLE